LPREKPREKVGRPAREVFVRPDIRSCANTMTTTLVARVSGLVPLEMERQKMAAKRLPDEREATVGAAIAAATPWVC
jgi:hypothetical protein